MNSYQNVLYSITLTGLLNGNPLFYHSAIGEKQAEFFVKSISNAEYLHRVFVSAENIEKIKKYARPSVRLFLEGELINYFIAPINNENHIIPEIFAKKIWFLDSNEPMSNKVNAVDLINKKQLENQNWKMDLSLNDYSTTLH